MPSNIVLREANEVRVVPGADVAAGTLQFYGTVAAWHAEALLAGVEGVAKAFNITLRLEKTNSTDTFAVGDTVNFDATTQKEASGGTACGICVKASANGDTYVHVALNQQL